MKYDSYFNQESIGWQGFILLPYVLLMMLYFTIIWILSLLPGLSLDSSKAEYNNDPRPEKKLPVFAYIFSAIVWLLFIYALFTELNNMN